MRMRSSAQGPPTLEHLQKCAKGVMPAARAAPPTSVKRRTFAVQKPPSAVANRCTLRMPSKAPALMRGPNGRSLLSRRPKPLSWAGRWPTSVAARTVPTAAPSRGFMLLETFVVDETVHGSAKALKLRALRLDTTARAIAAHGLAPASDALVTESQQNGESAKGWALNVGASADALSSYVPIAAPKPRRVA
ncbi:hypothetical protein AURDEDRAFT_182641 [Auricularia subglabra TFB-10046 SS5]|nr:hypothetical protein AURDEDRAFT_182641 [Auricularia subglabra TFB-10046 SS5]